MLPEGDGNEEESWDTAFLPYNRRVALADGDVVGGPLHIHTPDRESCGDKAQQSEQRSLQLPPTRFPSGLHFKGARVSALDPRVKRGKGKGEKFSCPDFSKTGNGFKSKAVLEPQGIQVS